MTSTRLPLAAAFVTAAAMAAAFAPAGAQTTGETGAIGSWSYLIGTTVNLMGTPISFTATGAPPITATFPGSTGTGRLYLGVGPTVQTGPAALATTYNGTGQISVAYSDL